MMDGCLHDPPPAPRGQSGIVRQLPGLNVRGHCMLDSRCLDSLDEVCLDSAGAPGLWQSGPFLDSRVVGPAGIQEVQPLWVPEFRPCWTPRVQTLLDSRSLDPAGLQGSRGCQATYCRVELYWIGSVVHSSADSRNMDLTGLKGTCLLLSVYIQGILQNLRKKFEISSSQANTKITGSGESLNQQFQSYLTRKARASAWS